MRYAAIVLPILSLLMLTSAGCSVASSRGDFPSRERLGVAFSRSGGLVGGSMSLIVATDGEYKVERNGRRIRLGSLSATQQADLQKRLAAVAWDGVPQNYPDHDSRDAFSYAVAVTSASGATDGLTATDASLDKAPRAVAALVRHLGALLDELSPR